MNELPLPEPCVWTDWTSIYSLDLVQSNKRLLRDAEGLFDAEQMKQYAAAAVAAERERCAQIADHHARRNYTWGSENSDKYHALADLAERIAAAIRKQEPQR